MGWGRVSGIVLGAALWFAASPSLAQYSDAVTVRKGATEHARMLMDRGLAEAAAGAHDQALVDFTAALSLHAFAPPDMARALFDRGVTLDAMGRTSAAIGDYSAALVFQPSFAAALNNRANAYRRLNRFDQARRDYLASLAAGDRTPEYADFGLGQIAEAQGDFAAARGYYAQAMAANPRYVLAGQRLSALGRPAVTPAFVLRKPQSAKAAAPPQPRLALARKDGFEPVATPATYGRAEGGPGLRPAIEDGAHQAIGGPLVQLGAWRDEAAAAAGWNTAQSRAGGALAGLTPQIVAVDLPGKGRYYRLRAGPVRGSAGALCETLVAKGLACMTVKDN